METKYDSSIVVIFDRCVLFRHVAGTTSAVFSIASLQRKIRNKSLFKCFRAAAPIRMVGAESFEIFQTHQGTGENTTGQPFEPAG
jgi:hypothetical protein